MSSTFSREQQMNPAQHPPLATSQICLLEQLQLVTREARLTLEAVLGSGSLPMRMKMNHAASRAECFLAGKLVAKAGA